MSHYVKRSREAREIDAMAGLVAWDAKTAWTGPLPTLQRAEREAAAWLDAGWQTAEVLETPSNVSGPGSATNAPGPTPQRL
jgi:hypothetical protein